MTDATDKLTIAAEIVREKARQMNVHYYSVVSPHDRRFWLEHAAFWLRRLVNNSTPDELAALLDEARKEK